MERVLSLIEHYGYLVVFFGVMMESKGRSLLKPTLSCPRMVVEVHATV